MAFAEGRVGPQPLSEGVVNEITLTRMAEMRIAHGHARYWDSVTRGNVYSVCSTAAVTIGALTTTAVTLSLVNPTGSGVNAAILAGNFCPTSTAWIAGGTLWAFNQQTSYPGGTAMTVRSNYLTGNQAASKCLAFSAVTLSATPVGVRPFFVCPSSSAGIGAFAQVKDTVDGELVLAPGGALTIQGSAAGVAAGLLGISWEETVL